MAKMRVYELAKELKVDNKELVRLLVEMDLDVRNHMSTLTPDEVQAVRDKYKAERSEVVEEKRVTKRVIRRRRKKIVAKPEPEPVPEPEPEAPAETKAAAEAQPPAEPETPAPEPEPAPEPPAAAEAPAEAQPPAEPETPAPEAETPPAEATAAAEAQPEPAGETAADQAEAKAEVKDETKPAKDEAKPAKKKPAKRRKDTPARIISRPTEPVAPMITQRPKRGPRPARPGRPLRPGQQPPPPPAPDKLEGRRARRKKSKRGGRIPDDEFLMSKASSRRKEIKNRADLYDGWQRRGRRRGGAKKTRKTELTQPKAIKRRIKVGEAITVGELAKRMGVKAAEVVGRLMTMGMMVTLNQTIDIEDATLVASEFGFEVERVSFEEQDILERPEDKPEDLKPRPPVATVMGHVDHGKTSLLDAIRKSRVAEGEAGGITQQIGAYDVHLDDGSHVIFVDTPGHEAFTEMRARGAKVTDVVVLVVAADDGVMEQTREAINHCRAAEVPMLVAVNKIDKPGADPDRVRRELSELDLVPEDWGGDTIFVNVSAKTGEGVDELLEMLGLQSELLELKANANKPAIGHVLEASLDKGRGALATVLVQEGTLRVGDCFVSGVYAGKVRAMFNDQGQRVDEAGPSIPVEVQGFGGVPEAGDDFAVVDTDKQAKQIANHRMTKKREAQLSAKTALTLEGVLDQMSEGQKKELNLVVKADTRGSVEALVAALSKLGNEEVKVSIIHEATGAITESDVMLAAASAAIIIGFNVRPTGKVSEVAEAENVEIRTYEVIYHVIDEVIAALTGMLAPVLSEEVIGRAEVRDTFKVPKAGVIAGSSVQEGRIVRGSPARLLRDGVVVATSKVSSLRRFKDDVKEVTEGFECGIGLENFNDIKIGDQIEVFEIRETAAEL